MICGEATRTRTLLLLRGSEGSALRVRGHGVRVRSRLKLREIGDQDAFCSSLVLLEVYIVGAVLVGKRVSTDRPGTGRP